MKDLLVFDMDGVLVDVTESYRETIRRTVHYFSGRDISRERIQEYKNQGGFNDDWTLTDRILQEFGEAVPYDAMVAKFQQIFHGEDEEGLIRREKWIAEDGLFPRLRQAWTLAIFTGRLHWEADVTLNRFAPELFDAVVGVDDVANPKPAPDGLLQLQQQFPAARTWYLGDTVDDARSAKAAGVPFIGVAPPHTPNRPVLIDRLRDEGAREVIATINELESLLNRL